MEGVSKKERFDLCLGMLKGYYDGLESRLDKSINMLVIVAGWVITFEKVREALRQPVLFWLATGTLTIVVLMYCGNVLHWVARFKEIQGYADGLGYVENDYYTRYRLAWWTKLAYLAPVVVLYLFIVACLVLM